MKFIALDNQLDQWETFVETNELGNFGQSSYQFELLLSRGRKAKVFGVISNTDDILVGGVVNWDPTRLGYKYSLDYGPLVKDWSDTDALKCFFDGLVEYAKRNKGLYLSVSPNAIYQEFDNDGNPICTPKKQILDAMCGLGFTHEPFKYGMQDTGVTVWQYVKKIDGQTYPEISKSYHKMAKQYLKKNKLFQVNVRELSRDDLPMFKKIIDDTAQRRHFLSKDLEYFETAYDKFQDRIKFVVAEVCFSKYIQIAQDKLDKTNQEIEKLQLKKETASNKTRIDKQLSELFKQRDNHEKRIQHGKQMRIHAGKDVIPVAGAMFIIMPQETDYLFSGSYEEYSEFYAPYQIQDYMLRISQNLGVKTYNFLGIDGKFDGVLKFKTQFEGIAQQLIGTFNIPINPFKFNIYKNLKKLVTK
ncbi:peptidoglycan bridge formation glycyltransferase FemA/FemB family protein [Weissella sagaensis]|uniref:peptidoglycan bridge formation glycyltransferase FemA/FemB family protein n=1 Tax=Weissella sagaensis TaxID=2559928 RepID=UPI0005AA2819|nr:peptidoglycan bridge formation glycyltransferase FemA/FemB family protein [Weissella sagaensis]QDJ58919.1 peptidoglycan bridge formation glycyltransferase FemA/FemB family protein [Weissella hellenica]QEA57916.1 aminoacyltransferase [Weissella hellenica]UEG67065.1 aminoacyltransferase [Weissella hellenica]